MPFWVGVLGLTLSLGITIPKTTLANPSSSEQTLTVAFLYNFLKFSEWPTQNTQNNVLNLCVTDNTAFEAELNAIDGRIAQNKIVRINRIELGESLKECQLLFLPREEKPIRIREWLKNAKNTPTLTVSNMDNFLDIGGMIALIDDGTRLQFEINLTQVKSADLKLSAQLLQIARAIRGK